MTIQQTGAVMDVLTVAYPSFTGGKTSGSGRTP